MKKRRLYIIMIFIGIGCCQIFGQQQPIISHYMFNHYFINPGAAGSSEKVDAVLLVRNQWVGIDGAPVTSTFNINAPFTFFGKLQCAFGFDSYLDNYGFQKDNGLKLGFTLRFNVGSGKLGIGASGGFLTSSLDFGDKQGFIADFENTFQDPLIPSEFENEFLFDLNAGIFYKTDDLYLGASSIRINAPEVSTEDATTTSNFEYVRHYYFMTGYNLYLSNPAFEISPSFIIRTDGKVMNFDLNAMLTYNNKIWGGLSYRNDASSYGIAFFGIELMKDLRISYAYELPSNNINKYTQQTHEFLINYSFSLTKEKTTQRYKSIRYL